MVGWIVDKDSGMDMQLFDGLHVTRKIEKFIDVENSESAHNFQRWQVLKPRFQYLSTRK